MFRIFLEFSQTVSPSTTQRFDRPTARRDNAGVTKAKLASLTLGPLLLVGGLAAWWLVKGPSGNGNEHTPEAIFERIAQLNKPVVLLNFWASWCEPCKVELPALHKLKTKYQDKGLEVLLVSIDDPDEIPAAKAYLEDNNLPFESLFKGSQPLRFVAAIYPQWQGAVPTTVLIGPGNKILDAWEGDTSFEEFEERVLKHLGGS